MKQFYFKICFDLIQRGYLRNSLLRYEPKAA